MSDLEKLQREKKITQTGIVGIVTNLFLVLFKSAIGLAAGSISIILDAINNLTDILSSLVTIIGVKIAKRPPDEKHPLGHGRVEYFSGILIALLVLTTGISSLSESVKKMIHPELADYNIITIVIISVAILTKILLGRFVKSRGKKYRSDALVASGADALFDAVLSASTLLGVGITMIWKISLDGYIGAMISLFILKAGIEMMLKPVNEVIGSRPDGALSKGIKADIRELDGVMGVYDLILHNYGPESAIGSVHIEIMDTMSAREIHLLSDRIHKLIYEKYHVFLTVGIYAVNTKDLELVNMQNQLREIVCAHTGVIGIHGIFLNPQEKRVTFDVVVSFEVRDRDVLRQIIIDEINEAYPDYEVVLQYDLNYSD